MCDYFADHFTKVTIASNELNYVSRKPSLPLNETYLHSRMITEVVLL